LESLYLKDFNEIFFSQINEFVKRARAAKIHAYIISHLKKEMPAMMGKAKAQQRLLDNLAEEFGKVAALLFLCFYHPCRQR
jgi:hypothetical protein